MSTLKLAKSITVLEDGKLSIFLFDNKEVYLQPTIIVDTLDSLQRLKIRDSVNYVDIDTSIEEIGGSPFGGTFPQLETAIRELAKSANSINYSGGGAADRAIALFRMGEVSIERGEKPNLMKFTKQTIIN
jgi:hypothetical protein